MWAGQQLVYRKGTAAYHQIAEYIRLQIRAGALRPGDRLPPEDELCKLFQVSRTTIRAALNELVLEGLIYRKQGRGSYVAEPKFEVAYPKLLSFTEEMAQKGLRADAKVLSLELSPASQEVAEKLNINPNDLVIVIKRLRLANDEPIGMQTVFIPQSLCPDLQNEDLSQSLYAVLANKYGIKIYAGIDTYYAGVLNSEEARLLRSTPGAPAFIVERITFTSEGKPIEYVRSCMRGDRYKITLWLKREGE